ncbi:MULTISPECIES: DUF6768 family protein [unclassified Shewanella]|uniref:DUF6768 family protein n=1 Tax=unclassified Shewanella TaxID=196818 RepID=UPI000C8541D5|nr:MULTISPECIES: DUF6768 family protein [unclassified Shewanella]MCC4833995.1 hypothetical protein [Shewanella sp. 10N.7]PMG74882.1 hypothetical protein BCU84_17500 [Shewanella sp. 10N.286.51.B7]
MSLDDKIREQLEHENELLKAQINRDPNLWSMLASAYQGRLGGWMIISTIVAFGLSALMLWCGYEFFFVESSMATKLQWGVGLLLSSMMQIAIKMWTFNEMNRSATQREIKKLEIAIQTLSQQITEKQK